MLAPGERDIVVDRIKSEIVPLCSGAGRKRQKAAVVGGAGASSSSSSSSSGAGGGGGGRGGGDGGDGGKRKRSRSSTSSFRAPKRVVLGINAVSRLLERGSHGSRGDDAAGGASSSAAAAAAALVVVACHDPRSPLLVSHLLELARVGGVPLLLLPGSASKLGELFGCCRTVSAFALAPRGTAAAATAAASDGEAAADGEQQAEAARCQRRLDDKIDSIAAFLAAKAPRATGDAATTTTRMANK